MFVTANALQVMGNMKKKKMLRLGDSACGVTCWMTYESESMKIRVLLNFRNMCSLTRNISLISVCSW